MPVFMASALAFGDGVLHLPSALAALIGAILIHMTCNLTNDYWDFKRGSNQAGEIDPMRVIPVGAITQQHMKIACIIVPLIAVLPCAYLINRGGWPIAVVAIAAILSAIFYTAGTKSFAYMGWGDIFAFVFFGPVAVAGTYWVQARDINSAIILSGIAPGLFAVAVLTINNIRDAQKDRAVNKLTLTVRLGRQFSYYEYLLAMTAISLLPVLVYYRIRDHIYILGAGLIGFLAVPTILSVLTAKEENTYNRAIGQTIQLLMIYSLLFILGWIFS